MKRILLAIILVSILLLGACSVNNEQAIKDTIKGWELAYLNELFSDCLDYYSQDFRARQGGDQFIIQYLRELRTWWPTIVIKEIGEPFISGETATVWVDYQEGEVPKSLQVQLVKESGIWKIDKNWY